MSKNTTSGAANNESLLSEVINQMQIQQKQKLIFELLAMATVM